jgi:hypothetical protein
MGVFVCMWCGRVNSIAQIFILTILFDTTTGLKLTTLRDWLERAAAKPTTNF